MWKLVWQRGGFRSYQFMTWNEYIVNVTIIGTILFKNEWVLFKFYIMFCVYLTVIEFTGGYSLTIYLRSYKYCTLLSFSRYYTLLSFSKLSYSTTECLYRWCIEGTKIQNILLFLNPSCVWFVNIGHRWAPHSNSPFLPKIQLTKYSQTQEFYTVSNVHNKIYSFRLFPNI